MCHAILFKKVVIRFTQKSSINVLTVVPGDSVMDPIANGMLATLSSIMRKDSVHADQLRTGFFVDLHCLFLEKYRDGPAGGARGGAAYREVFRSRVRCDMGGGSQSLPSPILRLERFIEVFLAGGVRTSMRSAKYRIILHTYPRHCWEVGLLAYLH